MSSPTLRLYFQRHANHTWTWWLINNRHCASCNALTDTGEWPWFSKSHTSIISFWFTYDICDINLFWLTVWLNQHAAISRAVFRNVKQQHPESANSANAKIWSWIRINLDPDISRIAPKMCWIHFLVCLSHFAECRKNRPVTAWEMLINLLKSTIPQRWEKWKSEVYSAQNQNKQTYYTIWIC